MAEDRIEIEIVLDDGSIQKGFAKLRGEAKKSERSMGAMFKRGLTKDISKPFDVARNSIFNMRTAVGGLIAVLGGGAFLRSVTAAASEQQNAVNSLNTSLATAGTFSQEASKNFQDLASSLQANSVFGDEVILQQAALARNFTKTNAEAEKLISASVELASATGISLDSAVKNLGKSYAGLAGELGESIPSIRSLTAEQLKAGGAIDLVANRFKGSALGATKTFSGALTQLGNTFGDLLERIGSVITDSPTSVATFNALSKTISGIGKGFNAKELEVFFQDLVINTAAVANAVVDSFKVIAQIPTFFKFVFKQLELEASETLQKILVMFEPATSIIDSILGRAGESQAVLAKNEKHLNGLRSELQNISKSGVDIASGFDFATAAIDDFSVNFREALMTSNSVTPTNSPVSGLIAVVDKDLETLRTKVALLQTETKAAIQDSFFNSESVLAGTPTVFDDVATKSTEALTKMQASLTQTRDKTMQLSAQIGQAVNNGVANTIANSVKAVVSALKSGDDAFGAFAKAALATIGDLAVQLGTTLIASGIGIEALKVLGGAAAVAAGIALVAVGTLISSATAGGSASSGSAVTPPLADLEPGGISAGLTDPGARVSVTINGSVFDSDETGIRIADILKEQGFDNAVLA
jgi:hypothetical protein